MTTLPPFQRLLDDHGPALLRFCVAAAGPDGEDCFQDALVSALRAYPTLRSARNLRGWLFEIAANKVADAHRRAARAPLAMAAVPDSRDRADARDGAVWGAVRSLPPMQRDAIAYRYAADWSYRDVAAAIGCSEAAARQNVRAGLRSLRATWTDD